MLLSQEHPGKIACVPAGILRLSDAKALLDQNPGSSSAGSDGQPALARLDGFLVLRRAALRVFPLLLRSARSRKKRFQLPTYRESGSKAAVLLRFELRLHADSHGEYEPALDAPGATATSHVAHCRASSGRHAAGSVSIFQDAHTPSRLSRPADGERLPAFAFSSRPTHLLKTNRRLSSSLFKHAR